LRPDSNRFERPALGADSQIIFFDLPEHGLAAKENGLRPPPMDFGSAKHGLSLCAHVSGAEKHDSGLRLTDFSPNSDDSGFETNGLAFGATVFGSHTYFLHSGV